MSDQDDWSVAFGGMSLDDVGEVPIIKERKATSDGILKKLKPRTRDHQKFEQIRDWLSYVRAEF